MSSYVFDMEADNLYMDVTKIHCIVAKDIDTQEVFKYRPEEIYEGLKLLYYADEIIGHNIVAYDIPVIQRFYERWEPQGSTFDTLVASRLTDPERPSHSLDSYGNQFGRKKPKYEEWDTFDEDMLYRCQEDVEINYTLYRYLLSKMQGWDWSEAMKLEQEIARIHLFQTVAGVDIDVEHAERVLFDIDYELIGIDKRLNHVIPKHYVSAYSTPIKLPFKKDGNYRMNVVKWFERV